MARKRLPGFAVIASTSPDLDADAQDATVRLFYAVPNPIKATDLVVLYWEVAQCAKVKIQAPGFDSGPMDNAIGSGYFVLPTNPSTTTTYTIVGLDATGTPIMLNGATITGSVTLTVR